MGHLEQRRRFCFESFKEPDLSSFVRLAIFTMSCYFLFWPATLYYTVIEHIPTQTHFVSLAIR